MNASAEPTSTMPPSLTAEPTPEPYRWRWFALFVVLAADVMDLLDSTIIGVAAPSIRKSLGGAYSDIQWFAAAYMLAFAVLLITGGRLGDIAGRRKMFLVGAAGFTLSSVLCGLAQTPEMLIGLRILQGALGALMIPQGLGVIKEIFPPREMSAAFGLFGPVMGLSAVCGPILAGALIDANLFGAGWRMIFLINVPLGLLALLGGLTFLPESRAAHAPRLDVGGMALVGLGVLLLIYPLVQGHDLDWPLWTFVMMAAAVPVFAVFAAYEARRRRRGAAPLVEPSLFRKRAFTGGLLVAVIFFAGTAGMLLVYGLYLQLGLGYSPLRAGLTLAPLSVGIALGAPLAGGLLAPRFGRMVLHAGVAIMVLGVIALIATVAHDGTAVTTLEFAPSMFVSGLGMGLTLAPLFDIVLAGVEPHEVGSASGLLGAIQQLGGAVGVAVLGAIFFGLLTTQVDAGIAAVTPTVRAGLTAAGLPAAAQKPIVAGFRTCVHDRAVQTDPSRVPASCRAAQSGAAGSPRGAGQVGHVLSAAGVAATKRDFSTALLRTLWSEVALLTATFGLAFLLPRHARPREQDAAGA